MLAGYCVTVLLLVIYGWLCWRDNKKKVIEEEEFRNATDSREQAAADWQDLTDKQVNLFRVAQWLVLMYPRTRSSGTPTRCRE